MTTSTSIPIVDLQSQYQRLKPELDTAVLKVMEEGNFINGKPVELFAAELGQYLSSRFVIPCANGTDALQLAYMALDLMPGDEILVPSFNYVAAAEAAALLGLVPVFIESNSAHFNLDPEQIEEKIGPKTRAIVAVHLFGQACDLESLSEICSRRNLFLIEDNAQAIGAEILTGKFKGRKLGTIGHIGTTSFFPSKNLGCMGDGGAVFCQDPELAVKLRMLANHGQHTKYQYQNVGINSRLDTLQAAVLRVKLPYLDSFIASRQAAAKRYSEKLSQKDGIAIPALAPFSSHVFHQYTLRFQSKEQRDLAKESLSREGIQTMIYYPRPLHLQEAYANPLHPQGSLPVAETLCDKVLSLPMHSELTEELVDYICDRISG